MVAVVPRLAGLEVEPVGVLVGPATGMRPVVQTGRLGVVVPGVDRDAARLDLRLESGAVAADEVDRRPGTVAGDEVAAVARVLLRRHDRAGHPLSLPSVPVEHRLQDRRDAMAEQDVADLVEVAEVADVELVQVTGGQIVKTDLEALVDVAAGWPDRVHVGLDRHQEHRIEAFGRSIAGVLGDVVQGGPERHGPGGVGDDEGGRAVGERHGAGARRDRAEAVPPGGVRVGVDRRTGVDLTLGRGEPMLRGRGTGPPPPGAAVLRSTRTGPGSCEHRPRRPVAGRGVRSCG